MSFYKMRDLSKVGKIKGCIVKVFGKKVAPVHDGWAYLYRGRFYILK